MITFLLAILIAAGLFLCMLIFLSLGRWLGKGRANQELERVWPVINVLEGSIFALMGLLIAFTFSGANSRFDLRRELMVQEVNAISTAYLQIDLLPPQFQPQFRESFRHYVDLRLQIYTKVLTSADKAIVLSNIKSQQKELWKEAVNALKGTTTTVSSLLLLPALNLMFDVANTRIIVGTFHEPWPIYLLLFSLALVGTILVGYDMSLSNSKRMIHVLGFILIFVISAYIILDLEFPRMGLINLASYDKPLIQLREIIK